MNRRDVLRLIASGSLSSELPAAAGPKPLRGVFPIAQTPFTDSGKLDLDALVEQVRFLHRGRVHGVVWPQLASEWSALTPAERFEGAEAIAAAGKKLSPAVVLGVQGSGTKAAIEYAKHAARAGADALISLPPADTSPAALLEYYGAIGRATELPIFLQAVGNLTVETILQLHKAIPTLQYVKDEAGQPLMRIAALRAGSSDRLKAFTGNHGRTFIDEMARGFSGSMPAASFADLYADSWDLWHAGKHREAMEAFSRAAMLINEVSVYGIASLKYILYLRGVFRTWHTRENKAALPAGSGLSGGTGLDEPARQSLGEMIQFLKPYLRA